MAIDGYTLGEYDQLVREVRGAGKLSLGAKRQLAESSSEVPLKRSNKERL